MKFTISLTLICLFTAILLTANSSTSAGLPTPIGTATPVRSTKMRLYGMDAQTQTPIPTPIPQVSPAPRILYFAKTSTFTWPCTIAQPCSISTWKIKHRERIFAQQLVIQKGLTPAEQQELMNSK